MASEPWVYGSTLLALAFAFVASTLLAAAFVAASFVTTAHRRVLAESLYASIWQRFKHSTLGVSKIFERQAWLLNLCGFLPDLASITKEK